MDIFINTDRPVDRSIVAGINQPQREAPIGAFVAGSSYDINLYFVKNDGTYNSLSGVGGTDIHVAISTISRPESGTFTLTDGTDTTSAISYGASAQVVEDALNALNSDTGLNLGTVSLVDVVKVNDTQYTITFRTFGAMTALSGSTVSLFPESTPTGSIAVTGSSTVYAQQTIELTRQPAIFQETWSTITNGFSGTIALNTTRLLQSLALEPGQPFYLEVKLDAETVAREIVGVEHSTMPASAFSGAAIALKSTEGVDILSTGETGGTKYLREDGDGTSSWQTVAGAAGDMEASTYDPTTVAGDAFDMDNMVEGTAKILTAAERTTIGTVAPHISDTANPHAVTKAQVGLSNVDDTADADKPVSTAQAVAIAVPQAAADAAQADIDAIYDEDLKMAVPNPTSITGHGFNITRNTTRQIFETDLDVTTFKHTPDNTYYVATTGNDSTGDGSSGLPYRSMQKAIDISTTASDTFATISVSAGLYTRDYNLGTISASNPIFNIICPDDAPAIMATSEELSWALHSGNAYVATNTITNFGCVDLEDIDENGIPRRLTKGTSAANVVSNPGTYYRTGTTTYVHRTGGAAPTNATVLVLTIDTGARFIGVGSYVSNLHFYGGTYTCNPVLSIATTPFVFDQCRFHTSWTNNALEATGLQSGKKLYMNKCSAHYGYNDGFNYHGGVGGLMVEIDCWSSTNGINTGLNSQNGTSLHDGISGIRVNGMHTDVQNRLLHDIGSGESWNLGITVGTTTTQSPDADSIAFYCGLPAGTDGMEMWLDSCTSRGGCALDFAVSDTCTLNVRDCNIDTYTATDTDTTGTIQRY